MDTNWCAVCGLHIDFSDVDLYCSETCRKRDELPQLEAAAAARTAAPSPTGSLTPSPSLTFHFLPSPSRISPPEISLGKPAHAAPLRGKQYMYQQNSL